MKRVLGLFLAVVLMLSACASEEDNDTGTDQQDQTGSETSKDTTETSDDTGESEVTEASEEVTLPYPEETIKIAVEIYDPTDGEFLAMKEYFDYLTETFNVEFMYSEGIESAEHELQFIENSAIAGCDAFMAYYNVSGVEAVHKVMEYDMYFWGLANETAIYEEVKDNPLYLGSVHYGDGEFNAGYEIGKYLLDQGAETIVYASGGADFGVEMFVKRRNGFLAAVEEASNNGKTIEVIDVGGFPSDAFFADQASALTKDIDAVCASFNGLDFWAQPIASAGKQEEVMLATIGSINEKYVEAFENGSVDFLAAKNIQIFGFAVPMIVNAVDGNADALKANGVATNAEQNYWLISSADQAAGIYEISMNEKTYSGEEFLSLVKTVNPEADADTLQSLISSDSIQEIKVRRSMDEE